MQRFDRLIRAAQRRRAQELAEQLPAEDPVVLQLLVAPLEDEFVAQGWPDGQVETGEKITPQFGHGSECK